MKPIRKIFFLILCFVVLVSINACSRKSNNESNPVSPTLHPLSSMEDIPRKQPTPEQLARIFPPEILSDLDGDGVPGTSTYWLTSQNGLPINHSVQIKRSVRAQVGAGKKILFHTRLNTFWLNHTSSLRQLLVANGYTVDIHAVDEPIPDLTQYDVLAIINTIGTPMLGYNDSPLSQAEGWAIQDFVDFGKGFFYTGDYLDIDMDKYNDVSSLFNVNLKPLWLDYRVYVEPDGQVVYYTVPWHGSGIFDVTSYYPTPYQPIFRRVGWGSYSCFQNAAHDIFKNVNSVLLMGSSYTDPRAFGVAALTTHPITSRPRDWDTSTPYPVVTALEYGTGRAVISCDSNAFANDGFSYATTAGADNQQFALNIFNWLAKASAETKPEIKILGLDFLAGSGLDNRNRLYDRKETFKSAPVGQKFLEPTQWEGTMDSTTGVVTESFNWPVSFVRNSASSLAGPSKFKLTVKVDDFKATNNPGIIEVEASGAIYGENGFQQPVVFSNTTFTPNSWPTSFTIETTTTLPNVVGIYNLEINWVFKSSGEILSTQRTPKAGDFHKVYTTWEKPLLDGKFKVGVPTTGGYFYAEATPTQYLEILDFSCEFLKEFGSTKTADDVFSKNLEKTYNYLGSMGYKYSVKETTTLRRGIDRLLDDPAKDGWCLEWSHMLKALNEAHGANSRDVTGYLKPSFMANGAIIADGNVYVALGGVHSTDLEPPPGDVWWGFKNHRYGVNFMDKTFDPTFGKTDPNYMGYFEQVFNYLDTTTTISDPVSLNYVDFGFEE